MNVEEEELNIIKNKKLNKICKIKKPYEITILHKLNNYVTNKNDIFINKLDEIIKISNYNSFEQGSLSRKLLKNLYKLYDLIYSIFPILNLYHNEIHNYHIIEKFLYNTIVKYICDFMNYNNNKYEIVIEMLKVYFEGLKDVLNIYYPEFLDEKEYLKAKKWNKKIIIKPLYFYLTLYVATIYSEYLLIIIITLVKTKRFETIDREKYKKMNLYNRLIHKQMYSNINEFIINSDKIQIFLENINNNKSYNKLENYSKYYLSGL